MSASLTQLRAAQDALHTWLAEAGALIVTLSSEQQQRAAAQLRRRQTVYRELGERQQASRAASLETRFPFAVRWTYQRGVLEVRDCFDGGWLQVNATEVPPTWRQWATEDAKRERAQRREKAAA